MTNISKHTTHERVFTFIKHTEKGMYYEIHQVKSGADLVYFIKLDIEKRVFCMRYNYDHLIERYWDESGRKMEDKGFWEKCMNGLYAKVEIYYLGIAKKAIKYYTIGLELIGFLALIIGRYVFHSSFIQIIAVCYLIVIALCSLVFTKKLAQRHYLSVHSKEDYQQLLRTAVFLQFLKEYQDIDIEDIAGFEKTAFWKLSIKSNHFTLR